MKKTKNLWFTFLLLLLFSFTIEAQPLGPLPPDSIYIRTVNCETPAEAISFKANASPSYYGGDYYNVYRSTYPIFFISQCVRDPTAEGFNLLPEHTVSRYYVDNFYDTLWFHYPGASRGVCDPIVNLYYVFTTVDTGLSAIGGYCESPYPSYCVAEYDQWLVSGSSSMKNIISYAVYDTAVGTSAANLGDLASCHCVAKWDALTQDTVTLAKLDTITHVWTTYGSVEVGKIYILYPRPGHTPAMLSLFRGGRLPDDPFDLFSELTEPLSGLGYDLMMVPYYAYITYALSSAKRLGEAIVSFRPELDISCIARWNPFTQKPDTIAINYSGLWTGDSPIYAGEPLMICFGTTAVPSPTTLLTPANSSTCISTSPTFTWNTSSGATKYWLQVSISSGFSSFIYNDSTLAGTSCSISGLSAGTVYYWRVKAGNVSGWSSWSTPTWSFTTTPLTPAIPTLVSPLNGAVDVSTSPILVWNVSERATSYRLQVSLSSGFGSFVKDTSLTLTSCSISGLSNSMTYYWRVNATNCGGTSTWSTPTWSFTTASTAYFIRNLDGFQFCNCSGVIWPPSGTPSYPFPDWNTFQVAYGRDQVLDSLGNRRPAAVAFWNSIKGTWGGSCFGFSAVSLHLFSNTPPYNLADWGVAHTINIPISDTIRRCINAEQIRQPYYVSMGGGSTPGMYRHFYSNTPADAIALINDIASNMRRDFQILCFFVYGWGGHAVVPYDIDTVTSTLFRIYCYDNWSAFYDYYFEINTATGAFVYHRGLYTPAIQAANDILLINSAPFAIPPIMDFYGGTPETKDAVGFSGTGKGFGSINVRNTSTGDVSFYSQDTFYTTGSDTFIVLIPSDTVSGPTTPNWALQLPSANYELILTGNGSTNSGIYLNTKGELFSPCITSLGINDTVKINLTTARSYKIEPRTTRAVDIIYAALSDTIYRNENLLEIAFPSLRGSVSLQNQITASDNLKIRMQTNASVISLYTLCIKMTKYSSTVYRIDSLCFSSAIPINNCEIQLIDIHRLPSIMNGDIYRDQDLDGVYEDTIHLTQSLGIPENTIQNYTLNVSPNPFNSALRISTPAKSQVEIFNINGKSLAKFDGGTQIWRPDNSIGSGIYLVRATLGDQSVTKRVVYLK